MKSTTRTARTSPKPKPRAPTKPEDGVKAARELASPKVAPLAKAPTWRKRGPAPDVVALGIPQPEFSAADVAVMHKATPGQLLRMVINYCAADEEGGEFCPDPVEAMIDAIIEDLQVLDEVFGMFKSEPHIANSFSRLIQRVRVAGELHTRQRDWLISQIEPTEAAS